MASGVWESVFSFGWGNVFIYYFFSFFSDGRVLSEPFMKLPSKSKLPDYYDLIRKPIDIKKLFNRIEEGKVKSPFYFVFIKLLIFYLETKRLLLMLLFCCST